MESVATKIENRLIETERNTGTQSASINRALELSDRFVKVTPQEYILPLNLFCQMPGRTAERGRNQSR
jgi:hypothetical protein